MAFHGSEKQVEWAERINEQALPLLCATREALREMMAKAAVAGATGDKIEAGERALGAIEQTIFEGDAGWWIDNRDMIPVATERRLPADDLARKMILPAFTMGKKRLVA